MFIWFVGGDVVPISGRSWKLCNRGTRDGLGMKLLQVLDCLMVRSWRPSFDLRYSAQEHSDVLSGHNYTGESSKLFLHILQEKELPLADGQSRCLGAQCFKMFPSPVEYQSQAIWLGTHINKSMQNNFAKYNNILFSNLDNSVAIHFRWYEHASKQKQRSWRRFGVESLVKHESALRFILKLRCSLRIDKKLNPIRIFVEDTIDSYDYIHFILFPALKQIALFDFVSIQIFTSDSKNYFYKRSNFVDKEYIHIIIGGDPIRAWLFMAFSGTLILHMGRRQSFSAFSLSAGIINTGTVLFGGPGFRKQLFPLHLYTDYKNYIKHLPSAKWNSLLSTNHILKESLSPIWPPSWNKRVISLDHVWIRLPTKLHFLYREYHINSSRQVPDLFTSLPPLSLLRNTTKITPLIFPTSSSSSCASSSS